MNIILNDSKKVKDFFVNHNNFKTLQCETVTQFWGKRSAAHVLEHSERYKQIQVNSQQIIQCLAFDVDHDDPLCYTDYNLPTPTLITLNQDNGKSHLLYYLKTPVNTYSKRAKRYLADIYDAITETLNADQNYTTYNTKNFLNTDLFRVYGSLQTHDLSDFRPFLDGRDTKPLAREKTPKISYFSRNCELFDTVRFYAYRAKSDFISYESFFNHILEKAQTTNFSIFNEPLPVKEAKDTAKSIARWTWENEITDPKKWNRDGYIKKDKEIVSAKRSEIRREAGFKHILECGKYKEIEGKCGNIAEIEGNQGITNYYQDNYSPVLYGGVWEL